MRRWLANTNINISAGILPPSIFSISSLQLLDVSSNKLYGEISRDIGNLTMLTHLYLAENDFTGRLAITSPTILYYYAQGWPFLARHDNTTRIRTELIGMCQNLLGSCPYRVDTITTRKFHVVFV